MESFLVAVMIDDLSVWTLRLSAGGGENDREGVKWGEGKVWCGYYPRFIDVGWFWSEGNGY